MFHYAMMMPDADAASAPLMLPRHMLFSIRHDCHAATWRFAAPPFRHAAAMLIDDFSCRHYFAISALMPPLPLTLLPCRPLCRCFTHITTVSHDYLFSPDCR